jgi:hypothetical protein
MFLHQAPANAKSTDHVWPLFKCQVSIRQGKSDEALAQCRELGHELGTKHKMYKHLGETIMEYMAVAELAK